MLKVWLWERRDGRELMLYEVFSLEAQANIGAAASRPTSFFDAVYLCILLLTSTNSAADLVTMNPDKAAKILFTTNMATMSDKTFTRFGKIALMMIRNPEAYDTFVTR